MIRRYLDVNYSETPLSTWINAFPIHVLHSYMQILFLKYWLERV